MADVKIPPGQDWVSLILPGALAPFLSGKLLFTLQNLAQTSLLRSVPKSDRDRQRLADSERQSERQGYLDNREWRREGRQERHKELEAEVEGGNTRHCPGQAGQSGTQSCSD